MKLRYSALGLTVALVALAVAATWGPSTAQTLPAMPERVALKMDTTNLSDGRHSIAAEVVMTDGAVQVIEAHFCVLNGTGTPCDSPALATATPAPLLLDLNTASQDELLRLPRDEHGQRLSLLEAWNIVRFRPYATLDDLARAMLEPDVIAAIRACNCTRQR